MLTSARHGAVSSNTQVRAIIQCAMDIESAPFIDALQDEQTQIIGSETHHQQKFSVGTLDGVSVMVVTSGIGLANAASAVARALMMVTPEIVVVAGTAGGLGVDVEVGDIAAGTSTLFSFANATMFDYAIGQIPQMPPEYASSERTRSAINSLAQKIDHPVKVGQVLSSDTFCSAEDVPGLREKFSRAHAVDMETASIALVCYGVDVDWVCLRAISDLCGPRADQEFHINSEDAVAYSMAATRAFITEI